MISARAKQPLARANYLSARNLCVREAEKKHLSRKMFLRSLKFNFGTMGEGTKAGRALLPGREEGSALLSFNSELYSKWLKR